LGRHWPMVGEQIDAIPTRLLRIGVQSADGRTATNISGHDRPLGGPIMWALQGGGSGRGGESNFHQGYWISPLPPPGPVGLVCEWPALAVSPCPPRGQRPVKPRRCETDVVTITTSSATIPGARRWPLGLLLRRRAGSATRTAPSGPQGRLSPTAARSHSRSTIARSRACTSSAV
jgi:hypothetical protein